ncbi:hypothetical protein UFOVP833_47 [uncultured Caudovirales phage]|uniref:Uncharacterized protein n=1 Tax=uncultured Caudovirales phage TaxID=2100421 RepID=A0A6J5P5S8_9CAUD|nr:hypothetical protein UFOVP833_47 [uncultured Caudovirales phage]CAB4218589.1 hypothetical protein UFOVP1603_41 [uncultured Caudovirales phage]
MWINDRGIVYVGDCASGDRKATDGEMAAWSGRPKPPPFPTIAELKAQLDSLAAQIEAMKKE